MGIGTGAEESTQHPVRTDEHISRPNTNYSSKEYQPQKSCRNRQRTPVLCGSEGLKRRRPSGKKPYHERIIPFLAA
ncbi:hypothetical protein D3C76_1682250 [compost metagenome]